MVKATSVGLGTKSMLADMNMAVSVHVLSDATAAIGIANRRGLGAVRRMAVHCLWVQERINNKDITLGNVWGTENPADLLTQHLDSKTLATHMSLFGMRVLSGRANEAPTLSALALRFPQRRQRASHSN